MSSLLDPGQIIKKAFDDANSALKINVVAGSTGGAEGQLSGDTYASGDEGVLTLGVRNDAGTALQTDGKYIPITTDSTGAVRVTGSFTEGATVADGGALPALTKVVSGYDGANVQVIKTDASGELQVDVLSSALPTGAATSALQTTGNSSLSSIDSKIPSNLTVTSTRLLVDGSGVTQPVSASSLPLPTGAATSANQATEITSLQLLDDVVGTDGAAVPSKVSVVAGSDGANARTLKTNATGELFTVLPTGAATELTLQNVELNTQNSATSLQLLDDTVATTGAAITAKGIAAVGTDGTNARVLKTDSSGELQIDVLSSALPTGAATAAKQDDGNTSLSSIDTKLTDKSQFTKLTDGTDTVLVTPSGELSVFASAQPGVDIGDVTVNNGSGASAVNIQDGGNSITIDGTISAVQSGTWDINNISGTVSLPTGAATLTEQQTQTSSLQLLDNIVATHGSATVNTGATIIGTDGTDARIIKTDASGELQIDVLSSALPSGASTSALQTSGNSSLSSIDGKIPSNLTVTSTRLLVDGSGVTQPVSATSLPLPSGASTLAEQQTQTTSLQLLDDTVATTGAAITAKGIAISGTDGTNARVLKTDSSGELQVDVLTMPTTTVTATDLDIRDLTSVSDSISAVQSGTWNINNVSGTVSLPTGAATAANQSTEITSLQLLDDVVATTASAIPSKGYAVSGTDGTNARILKTDASGELQVDVLTMPTTTVTATDLDIRDLTSVSDSVSAVQSGNWQTRTLDGSGNSISSTSNALHVNVQNSSIPVTQSGNFTTRVQDSSGNSINSTSNALHVNVQNTSIASSDVGHTLSEFIRNDYSSVNVTTAAYTQLIASTSNTYQELEIFDSSGQTLKIALGAAASEVDKLLVFPGGNGRVKYKIPSGSRISIKAVSATASVGEICINLYG